MKDYYQGKHGPGRLEEDRRRMRRVPKPLREAIRHAAIGADSPPERTLSRQLRAEGIYPKHNVRIAGYRFDLKIGKLLVEVDGWEYHKHSVAFQADRTKQNAAVAHGYTVLRFTADDIIRHLSQAVLLVKATLEVLKGGSPQLPTSATVPYWRWHLCV
ncbi:endonuclease domain-containing protein [Corynebacterium sp.]|uniref:endonuclease domain-containing protein n=2 Tax=Corynebacteriaceae TaxID=1653 RepID=UPI00292FFE6A|nr:DUF559 domain-containing protein [Corynebacterium sp.]